MRLPERWIYRRRLRVDVIVVLWMFTGCGSPPVPTGDPLADLVPIAEHGVSTDIILPSYQDSLELLGQGWEVASAARATEEGLWVVGHAGHFRFYSATTGPLTLEAEAVALSTSEAPQGVEVFLNGQSIHRGGMTRRWNHYEFLLPVSEVRVGWNEVALKFDVALRPVDINRESLDARRLSARFRRLRLRSAAARGAWSDRPSAVDVMSVSTDDTQTITMPTDSVLTVHIVPRAGTFLRGVVDVRLARQAVSEEVSAVVEVLDASGKTHMLFEHHHAMSKHAQRFEISLQRWVGEPVRLRLRCWGRDNGVVNWNGLILSTHPDVTVADVTRPTHLAVPPVSGRLGRPDVLLILLDAARADAFNSDLVSTPAVDALAAAGTRFHHALAPAPWTGQSVPSMLTGWYPGAIGAEVWRSPIPVDVPTLAERLSQVGYHTALWSQHNLYGNNETFRRGFQQIIESRGTVLERAVLPTAEDLFVDDQPAFTLIHLLPPHGPYRPPPPFDGSLSAWYTGDFPQSAASLNRASQPTGRKPTADDVRYIRARYHENVRFADHLVGRLVQMFRDVGRYDDAIIIVTSDHGEGFFEHGQFLHSRLLYEEFVKIPFVIKWPTRLRGFLADVDESVSLVDVVPTLVDGLELPAARPGFQGRTLLPLVLDGVSPGRDLFVQTRGAERLDVKARPVVALLSDGYKVIFNEAAGTLEMYNLNKDPAERHDLTDVDPLRARALLQRLLLQHQRNALALSEQSREPTVPLDEESIRRLRALGYL